MTTAETAHSPIVYKIATRTAWAEAVAGGAYRGSADDARDGYIHLSMSSQLTATANKYFNGVMDLVLVAIPAADLGECLIFELSRGGELFPHYYGSLPVKAARWVRPLPLDETGVPCVAATLGFEPNA